MLSKRLAVASSPELWQLAMSPAPTRTGSPWVEVSTVQVRVAGVASVLREASVARTSKVWEPSERPVWLLGEVQLLNVALSKRHSKVEPASEEENANEAKVLLTVPEGPEPMVVSGGVVSVPPSLVV